MKRTFTNETIDSISVQDDLSVSLMLNKNLQKTRLENSVAGLNQSVREYENHHGDGVQRIEYSEDYRKCRVYVEREYIDKKLNKNLNHSYSRMDLAILLYRIQVWQGVSPEDLFAEISVVDPDTDELISRETFSGGIWLQE